MDQIREDGMQKDHLRWELVSETKLVDDEWIDFRRSEWRFPNGVELGPFYTYHRIDYVVIVCVDEDGNYVCVRQFRQGIGKVTCEFPAGGMEEGEEPLDAAKRELREETGYVSDRWTYLAGIPSNATMADNYAHLFLAQDCRREAPLHLDDTEFVETEIKSGEELDKLIREGAFHQAAHCAGFYMAQRFLD